MATTARHPASPSANSLPQAHDFWVMAHGLAALTERERIISIGSGFEAIWLTAVKAAFGLPLAAIASLVNTSNSTVERRIKSNTRLDPVASERIDRLAQIAVLAEDVFEDKSVASAWMSSPNDSLGGDSPFALCETELGARQVRRVLHAIEWGGVA